MFSDLHPDQVVPRRHPPGARAPRASATARCSSPARSTSSSSRCGRCSTTSCAPALVAPSPTARTAASSPTCRRPGEARAQALVDYADANGFDLAEAVAYADSASDLPMLEAVGFPVAVNPETRLAAIARKRGWLVEHWDKAAGAPAAAPADRPRVAARPTRRRPRRQGRHRRAIGRADEGAPVRAEAGPVRGRGGGRAARARAAAPGSGRCAPRRRRARAARPRLGAGAAPAGGHLRQRPRHHRRARRRATSSRSCRSRSCPATRSSATSTTAAGSCSCPSSPAPPAASTRRATPCAAGRHQPLRADRLRPPRARPADRLLRDTGGGWSTADGRPRDQLVAVPDDLTDEEAVLVEPTACAVHAARAGRRAADVAVIGAGTLGLLTVAALRRLGPRGTDHRHRQAPRAADAGHGARRRRRRASPASWPAPCASATGSMVDRRPAHRRRRRGRRLRRLAPTRSPQALDVVGARRHGRTSSACPASTTLDLTAAVAPRDRAAGLLRLRRATTSTPPSSSSRDADLGRLGRATYPLDRYEDAIDHAANAGRRGAVKIAFDLRRERERNRI